MVQHSFLAIFHNSKIINPDNFTHFYQLSTKKIGKGKQLLNSARGHYFPIVISFFNFLIFVFRSFSDYFNFANIHVFALRFCDQ